MTAAAEQGLPPAPASACAATSTTRGMDGRAAGTASRWQDAPIVVVPYACLTSALGCLVSLPTPRPDFLVTAAGPVVVLAGVIAARLRQADRPFPWGRWAVWSAVLPLLLVALAAAIPAQPAAAGSWDARVGGYEVINGLLLVLLLAQVGWVGGRWSLLVVLMGLVYGMCLESLGIVLGVFAEDGYHAYVPGFRAPVATMVGWVTVFVPCWCVITCLTRGFPLLATWPRPARAALLGLVAVAIDLQVDPVATAMGLWVWHPSYATSGVAHWFGVPLVNFLSWFAAVTAFGWVVAGRDVELAQATRGHRVLFLVLAVPGCLALAALLEVVAVLLVEGPGGPTWALFARVWG